MCDHSLLAEKFLHFLLMLPLETTDAPGGGGLLMLLLETADAPDGVGLLMLPLETTY